MNVSAHGGRQWPPHTRLQISDSLSSAPPRAPDVSLPVSSLMAFPRPDKASPSPFFPSSHPRQSHQEDMISRLARSGPLPCCWIPKWRKLGSLCMKPHHYLPNPLAQDVYLPSHVIITMDGVGGHRDILELL